MSDFNIPGMSFSKYLQQEHNKWREANYVGIFQDIEAEEAQEEIKLEVDARVLEARVRIRDAGYSGLLRCKGTLDCRIPKNYPGPAKQGSFWIVEYPGQIGSHPVKEGDILVRLNQFNEEWQLIPKDDPGPPLTSVPNKEIGWAERYGLLDKKPQPKPPRTKAAPGPQKRKVILEDE